VEPALPLVRLEGFHSLEDWSRNYSGMAEGDGDECSEDGSDLELSHELVRYGRYEVDALVNGNGHSRG
jgi:hypothetical protein